MRDSITLIATGGTIAKTYGSGRGIRDLHIGDLSDPYSVKQILERMALDKGLDIDYRQILQKDSLDINDEDRRLIVRMCQEDLTSRIVITHGTDTMKETALALDKMGLSKDKTIVLTGSLLPACVRDTDAEFNLGLALGACLYARPGIYIALNGVHIWYSCKKHPETGFFEPK